MQSVPPRSRGAPPPSPPPEPDLASGDVVAGTYRIVRPIGAGGQAVVYEARRVEDDAAVAIKVLAASPAHAEDLEQRFFEELLLATRVKHPNIVEVHDFGVTEPSVETGASRPYLVMELLHGEPLSRALTRGPLEQGRALRLFAGVLSALAEAHERGVVHRDLKPSNLFLAAADAGPDRRGAAAGRGDAVPPEWGVERLVVLDFGIAQRGVDPGTHRAFTGTPRYTAPESIERGEVGPAVDTYQLGLVLIEALTARAVVQGKAPSACFPVHLQGVTVPETIDPAVREVLARAVHRDPKKRPSDASFAEDLLRCADAPPPRAVRPALSVRRRYQVALFAVGVVATAVGLSAVLALAIVVAIALLG